MSLLFIRQSLCFVYCENSVGETVLHNRYCHANDHWGSLDGRCSLPPVCAVDSNVFVSLTKGLISPLARLHSHSQVFTSLFFQTLTEVRALRFPEVFSKNNVQEVSGCLLPPSGCQHKLRLNPDSCLSREQAQKKKKMGHNQSCYVVRPQQNDSLCESNLPKWFT